MQLQRLRRNSLTGKCRLPRSPHPSRDRLAVATRLERCQDETSYTRKALFDFKPARPAPSATRTPCRHQRRNRLARRFVHAQTPRSVVETPPEPTPARLVPPPLAQTASRTDPGHPVPVRQTPPLPAPTPTLAPRLGPRRLRDRVRVLDPVPARRHRRRTLRRHRLGRLPRRRRLQVALQERVARDGRGARAAPPGL